MSEIKEEKNPCNEVSKINLLPFHGALFYFPIFFDLELANTYFNNLECENHWKSDAIRMYGKTIQTKRKYAWMGDAPFSYNYSQSERIAENWTPTALLIKNEIEKKTLTHFNSCLLNRYGNGNEGMAWHADNETCMLKHGTIASVSFGDTRTMEFKHKFTGERIKINLEHGSLLLMQGEIQDFWLHQLTKTTKSKNLRINLTYRTFIEIT